MLDEWEFEKRKKFVLERQGVGEYAYNDFAWPRSTYYNEIVNDPFGRLLLEIDSKLDRLLFAFDGHTVKGYKEGEIKELNISGSGLSFNADKALSRGALLEMEFVLPVLPQAHIHALGRVVRTEQKSDDIHEPQWPIGVKFAAISDKDREEIIRYTFIKQRQLLRSSI
jgi:hypothetical protein